MLNVSLDMYQMAAIAVVALVLGKAVKSKIPFLSKFCIPTPVIGGLLFSILNTILHSFDIISFSFDNTLQKFFMLMFFCYVGYLASFKLLFKSGIKVIILLLLAIAMIVTQNITGVSLAKLLNIEPLLGLSLGSVSLIGGHGTSSGFGPEFEKLGIDHATLVALTSATFGLVIGGLIGGPLAHKRIKQYHLVAEGNVNAKEIVFNVLDDKHQKDKKGANSSSYHKTPNTEIFHQYTEEKKYLIAINYLLFAIGIGTVVSAALNSFLTFPTYMGALFSGVAIRNIVPQKYIPIKQIDALGNVFLQLFLAMAMCSLELWKLVELAMPMVLILCTQTIIVILFAYFIVFNVLGKNYTSAVITAGFCGFSMGATPNAMANMAVITQKYGSSPTAYMVVPIVGSFLLDPFNAVIITAFMNIFS